jgi:hypothetical protein
VLGEYTEVIKNIQKETFTLLLSRMSAKYKGILFLKNQTRDYIFYWPRKKILYFMVIFKKSSYMQNTFNSEKIINTKTYFSEY